MPFRVQITARAERDFWDCYNYIFKRSAEGASRWVDAFDNALSSLEREPARGMAPENHKHEDEIHQQIFRTARGLPYRLLFVVRNEVIHVIHIRGPGQDLMFPDDIEIPDAE